MNRQYDVTVAVGNIRGNPVMPQRKVEHDCLALMALADVIFVNEMKRRRYDKALHKAAEVYKKTVVFTRRPNAVAHPKSWQGLRSETVVLTKGDRRVPQPKRELNLVHDDVYRITYGVTHLTNAAWNRKRRPFKGRRRRLWLKQQQGIQEVARRLHREGRTFILCGDMNTGPLRRHIDVHSNQRTIYRHGLMHMIIVPAPDVRVLVDGTKRVGDVFTDHPLIRGRVTLKWKDGPYSQRSA